MKHNEVIHNVYNYKGMQGQGNTNFKSSATIVTVKTMDVDSCGEVMYICLLLIVSTCSLQKRGDAHLFTFKN